MVVFVDVVVSALSMSDYSCVFHGASIHDASVLNPLRNLVHCSAVVPRSVMMSPVVVRQRDSFRFWFRVANPTGNVSVTLVTWIAVLL